MMLTAKLVRNMQFISIIANSSMGELCDDTVFLINSILQTMVNSRSESVEYKFTDMEVPCHIHVMDKFKALGFDVILDSNVITVSWRDEDA